MNNCTGEALVLYKILKMSKRGRKTNVPENLVLEAILEKKSELLLEDGQVAGKDHKIWKTFERIEKWFNNNGGKWTGRKLLDGRK